MLKLGSLFSGIGGFELSATRHGIVPVWASEIERACISITKRHFPDMAHLGDITYVKGNEIEPVDIISFGSPCQDFSTAGRRDGLEGKRSSLFIQAIRIINEMRMATNDRYPRWAIWENVPGALSSGNGVDFKTVLKSFCDTEIPMPNSGKWAYSGMVRGGRCDVAWRTLNAQHFGVPQRRRRIFLVADFRARSASEVLFERNGVQGNTAKGTGAAGVTKKGVADTGVLVGLYENHQQDKRYTELQDVCSTATSHWETGGNNLPIVVAWTRNDDRGTFKHGIGTLTKRNAGGCAQTASTILAYQNVIGALQASNGGHVNNQTVRQDKLIISDKLVRRLTPRECERLQGFPDDYTAFGYDDKPISDSARYAAIGNSVAIPCVEFIMRRIAEVENAVA